MGLFFLAWISCYFAFQLKIAINEQRYFLPTMPAFAGMAACMLGSGVSRLIHRRLAYGLVLVGFASNVALLAQLPRGLVGNEAVAQRLAGLNRPGNVLVASPGYEGDLMFRYRALKPNSNRAFLRSDRTLAIRRPGYERVPTEFLVHSVPEVLRTLRRGRVRYLVTYSPVGLICGSVPEEVNLAHRAALSEPDKITLIGEYPILFDIKGDIEGRFRAFVWEYQGELPDGPSEIPILIPRLKMEIQSNR